MESIILGIDKAIEETLSVNSEIKKSHPLFNRGRAIVNGYTSVKELILETENPKENPKFLCEKISNAIEVAKQYSKVRGASGYYYTARLKALEYAQFNISREA